MRLTTLALLILSALVLAGTPKFRTDADGPFDPKQTQRPTGKNAPPPSPPWYQLVEGQFPPENSAHAIPGELMLVDHLERRFQIRVDRADNQDRGIWDLPLDAVMLPYGAIWYHGAPAALQDIPLGTHLHGLFYLKDPEDKTPPPPAANNRKTPEYEFRRCFLLEDDFTFQARQKQLWKIDSIDPETKKLTATLQVNGAPEGQPKIFDFTTGTRVFKGTGFADLKALEPGQTVLFNLTWVTLYGPGRITDMWLDEPSRSLASAHQMELHRNHIRERGLAGWVSAVDDEAQIVTITFFGGIDPKLFDDLGLPPLPPPPNATPKPGENPGDLRAGIAVARESLMTYDPVNDRKTGTLISTKKIPAEPGSSGVQIQVKVDMMLEGYRPKKIVRVYPGAWKVNALPKEEQYFGRE
jgi:hypothetical protein